jgi:hypothetical protein
MFLKLSAESSCHVYHLRTRSVVTRVPVGTSQVLSLNPSGSEFRLGLKNSSPLLILKAQAKAWRSCGNGEWHRPDTHMGCGGPCVRGERGSGVFSDCVRRPFFLTRKPQEGSYPRQAKFYVMCIST